jgi:hypothetical protein
MKRTNNGEHYYNEAKSLLQERLCHDEVQYTTLLLQLEDYYNHYQKQQSEEWLQNLKFLLHKWNETIPQRPKPIPFYLPRLTNLSNATNLKEYLNKK